MASSASVRYGIGLLLMAVIAALPSTAAATPSARVIDGTIVPLDHAPYVGALILGGDALGGMRIPDATGFTCGVSLIAPRWGLTAAHCIEAAQGFDGQLTAMSVVFGKDNLAVSDAAESVQRMTVDAAEAHPNFATTKMLGDIAVVHFTRPVRGIQPITLNADRNLPQAAMTVEAFGWGAYRVDSVMPSAQFRSGTELVLSSDEAWQAMGMMFEPETMFAVSANPQIICHGDSGGPAVAVDPTTGALRQVGIASWVAPRNDTGDSANCVGRGAVYTRVASYRRWLERATHPRPRISQPIISTGINEFGDPIAARPKRVKRGTLLECVAEWTPAFAIVHHQWLRNGVRIPRQQTSTYRVQRIDGASSIRCQMQAATPWGRARVRSAPLQIPAL